MKTINELERDLKQGNLNCIYLLYGEELYLLENCIKKIKNLFGETINGINQIIIEENNIQELNSHLITPAFGYEKKLIIIKNTGLLKKEGKKKNIQLSKIKENFNTFLIENAKLVEETLVIIIVEDEVEKKELFNAIDKIGVTCNFDFLKPIEIEKRIKAICNAYHVEIEKQTLQYFIECCGTNMQELINEIRKLIEYAGENGKIENQDIDKLCIKKLESVIFDLTDNLGKRNIKMSLDVLHNLIYEKEPIQKILITLYNHFKKLYITSIAVKENKDIASSLNLKPNQMFLINKYKNQSRYFKEKELKKIVKELIDLDYNYKNGLIDLQLGLETILCENCS